MAKSSSETLLQKRKRRFFDIIQIGNTSDMPSRLFDYVLVTVILINIAVMFLQTFDSFEEYMPLFHIIEILTGAFFCVEYVLRIWTSDYLYPELTKRKAVFRFLRSFDGIVDLLTILPFFFLSGFVAFRMLRVVRIFHLFRINTYYDSFHVIKTVLYEKRNQIISSVFIIVVLMLASSLFMYSAEHEAQPEAFRNAFSGIWWSMSTLLTVGYGDIYPVTFAGRLMAIIIAFLGVGAVAIPTGIISAGFVEQYSKAQEALTRDNTEMLFPVVVDIDSRWLGYSVGDMEKDGFCPVMIKRGDMVVSNYENYEVMLGDRLTVYRKR